MAKFKTKYFARTQSKGLMPITKVGINRKTFATRVPVERDAIGRIVLYDVEGHSVGRKPKEIVDIGGQTYFDDE